VKPQSGILLIAQLDGLFHEKSFYKCMINIDKWGYPHFRKHYETFIWAMVDRLYPQIGGWSSTRDLYSQERLRFPIWDG